jgi:hypothetical protein
MQAVQNQIGTSYDKVPGMLDTAQNAARQRQNLAAIAYITVLNESIKKAMDRGTNFNVQIATNELMRNLLGGRDLEQTGDTRKLENTMGSQRNLFTQIGEQAKKIEQAKKMSSGTPNDTQGRVGEQKRQVDEGAQRMRRT